MAVENGTIVWLWQVLKMLARGAIHSRHSPIHILALSAEHTIARFTEHQLLVAVLRARGHDVATLTGH